MRECQEFLVGIEADSRAAGSLAQEIRAHQVDQKVFAFFRWAGRDVGIKGKARGYSQDQYGNL